MLPVLRVPSHSNLASRPRCCATTVLTTTGASVSCESPAARSFSRGCDVLWRRRSPLQHPGRSAPLHGTSGSQVEPLSLRFRFLLLSFAPRSIAPRLGLVHGLRGQEIPSSSLRLRLRLSLFRRGPCVRSLGLWVSVPISSDGSASRPSTGCSLRVPGCLVASVRGVLPTRRCDPLWRGAPLRSLDPSRPCRRSHDLPTG